MAILLNNEVYVKLDLRRSFINMDGLYTYLIYYRSEAERLKEKDRYELFEDFIFKCRNEVMKYIDENGELILETTPEIPSYKFFCENISKFLYIIGDEERFTIDPDILTHLLDLGAEKEWFDDPVKMQGEITIRVADYHHDRFELDVIYEALKKFYIRVDEVISDI